MAYDYELLHVETVARVATVTIDAPPINVMTTALYRQLVACSKELAADDALTVVVMKSADPDFFIAHFDVEAILRFPTVGTARRMPELSDFHLMCERFRTMNKVTIAQIEGRAGGGGNELAASFDMRFGVRGKTIFNHMEVPLGILPGGTGTQRLPRIIGRHRAMEMILAGEDIDAETAERWGYLNRIFSAEEIGPRVAKLAKRIASFPVEAVRLAKEAITAADTPLSEGLPTEAYLFQCTLRTASAQANLRKFLEIGGQTRDGEMRIAELNAALGRIDRDFPAD